MDPMPQSQPPVPQHGESGAFSVLILTLNEEQLLPACLDSVSWCDDVVVLDSFSTDGTEAIARSSGARFVQRRFDDFAGQRNYAIDHIEFKHPWVFHLDADERFTPELRAECEAVIESDEFSGFLVPSKMMLWGRWLKWSTGYPVYQMRLMKIGEIRFTQHGHGQREAEAQRGVGQLRSAYLHDTFAKGLDEWFDRHNRYSTQEAESNFQELAQGGIRWGELVARDPVVRRRALKRLSVSLPLRPLVKFCYLYFIKCGLLDGGVGFTYCVLQAIYEYMITLKLRELIRERRRGSGGA